MSDVQQPPQGELPVLSSEEAAGVRLRSRTKRTVLAAHGQPYVWFAGGMLALSLVMIIGLILLVVGRGASTFWPLPLEQVTTHQGQILMGEMTRSESYRPRPELIDALPAAPRDEAKTLLTAQAGVSHRQLFRTGNFELTNEHFNWVSDFEVAKREHPRWGLLFERLTWGRFYGFPKEFRLDGQVIAREPAAIWVALEQHHQPIRERWQKRRALESEEIGEINHRLEAARLALHAVELKEEDLQLSAGKNSTAYRQVVAELEAQRQAFSVVEKRANAEYDRIREQIDALNRENARAQLVVTTIDGQEKELALDEIVRSYAPNQLSLADKFGIYFSRWAEYLADDPREANSEGGVFPAIFGTAVMTVLMSLCVVPFGVLAALYLREYAKAGPLVSVVRIAVNNLAGVPSIVFGVFGLGFFCYLLGGSIDQIFFSAKLPSPTYGTGGILWASLTLALLTLPVVIVATEEALAAVPSSMREGSYACGASKWQTIRRIVLPRAMPGIMTGMILAMARGAGEVAPLMLVGAVKLAPELPLDGFAPFVHLERSFMHLGFHIYDLGFQSQNSEAAIPMVFTTTLLLILMIAALNVGAIWLRNRLRRKFIVSQF